MLGTDDECTQPRASLPQQRPQCPFVKLRQVQQEVVRDASEAAQTGWFSSTSSRRDCDPSATRQASIHTRGWTSRIGAGIPRPRSPGADLDPRFAQLWRERQPPEPGWPGSPPHGPFGVNTCVYMYVIWCMTWAILGKAEFGSGRAHIVGLVWSLGHVDDEMGVFTWSFCRDILV